MGMNEFSKKDRETSKKYLVELGIACFLYVATLFTSIWIAKGMADGLGRTLVVMLPALPAFAALMAILRSIKRMDEYVRVRMLEILALSGGLTAFIAFSYGFLEGLGYPRLSGFVMYGIFMVGWLLVGCIRSFLEREK
ncbi:MAG: hypothetical protein Q8Q55_00770 [Undibacterium sp.]|nr:hypothetical protein [Undibacterium sp.]